MNCGGVSDTSNPTSEIDDQKDDVQTSLEMYEMYSPDKNKAHIPYINNHVIGLVKAVSGSDDYIGPKHLTLGNFYYKQGRYRRAIENYILNILPERYTLTIDRKDSFLGLARCYLELDELSNSINHFNKAFELFDDNLNSNLEEYDLFLEITDKISKQYGNEITKISNSLELCEFIGEILEDKSGWELALRIIEFITGSNN